MPSSLSLAAYIEKNKLGSDGAWLILAEITLPDSTVIHVCRNTENVTWPSVGGDEYAALPFDVDDLSDHSKNEVPRLAMRVSNVSRTMQGYVEAASGGVGSTVVLRVVHSDHLDETSAEYEGSFQCTDCHADAKWVTFFIGAPAPWSTRFPRNRVIKDYCRWRFKSTECGYSGGESTCDKTLTRCRALSNSERYGGYPGVGQGGVYA